MSHRVAAGLSALATIAILVATLHSGSGGLTHGWSYSLTSGDASLAELIQNLLLFIPLGVSLTLARVWPGRVVAIGALLSFTVEFLQQYIPGRDPSVGDIVCNTISTALGVLLVVAAPIWLWASPRRSAWQARLAALIAVLVWYGTGVMLQQIFPPLPYHLVTRPDIATFRRYQGAVLKVTLGERSLEVRAVAAPARPAPYPPGRAAPLVAVFDRNDERVLMLSVDGSDLTLRYDIRAVRWTLEQPDLRLRGGMKPVAPGDTFTAASSAANVATNYCLRVNSTEGCHLGYTIGDGWKLIYFLEGRPEWMLGLINTLWIAGGVIWVGYWAARGTEVSGGWLAMGLVIAGLLIVPLLTGLKPTPVHEWIGALGGMAVGYWLPRVRELFARQVQ